MLSVLCYLQFCLVSSFSASLCWVSLCWVLCWVKLCWVLCMQGVITCQYA